MYLEFLCHISYNIVYQSTDVMNRKYLKDINVVKYANLNYKNLVDFASCVNAHNTKKKRQLGINYICIFIIAEIPYQTLVCIDILSCVKHSWRD